MSSTTVTETAQEIVERVIADARRIRREKRRRVDWHDYEHCKRQVAHIGLTQQEYFAAIRAIAEALHL